MLLRDRTCLLLSVTVVSTLAAQVTAQPSGVGFTVEVYAEMCDPSALSFDSNGFLFVGNGGCGVGCNADNNTNIHSYHCDICKKHQAFR